MRMLFTTDLHGCKWKYARMLAAARRYDAEMVINGGDMLPKEGNLFDQGNFISRDLDAHFAAFNDAGVHYLCYLGNDDLKIFDDLLESICQRYRFVHVFAQRKLKINGYEFIGMNWVVDYPFRLKDRCRMDTSDYSFQRQYGTGLLSTAQGWQEVPNWLDYARSLPTIEAELEGLIRPDNPSRAVYTIHMPPSDLGLDECGHGANVGSKAIYRFLQRLQPRLSLHGHIHESPETSGNWFGYIGQTLCVQPGQLEPFTYVVVDLETMRLDRQTESQQL
jgi:Icc-related predicted phosphoesterase